MARLNDQYEVIGFLRIDYVKKATGDRVQGYEVYLTPTQPPEGLIGVYAEKVYLSEKYAFYKPEIGDIVRKAYNRFGSVEDLIVSG